MKCNKELGAPGVIKLKSYFSKEKVAAEKEYRSIHVYPHTLLFHAESLKSIIQKMTSAIYYVNSQGVLSTQIRSIN